MIDESPLLGKTPLKHDFNDHMAMGMIILCVVPILLITLPFVLPVYGVGRTANWIGDRWST
jgi:hypothetical protein